MQDVQTPAQSTGPCNWLALATPLTGWLAGRQQHKCSAVLSDGHASVRLSDRNYGEQGRLTSILLIVAQQVWQLLVLRIVQDQVLVDVNEDDPSVPVFELVQAALISVQLRGLRSGPGCKPVICRQQKGVAAAAISSRNLLGPKTVLLLALKQEQFLVETRPAGARSGRCGDAGEQP